MILYMSAGTSYEIYDDLFNKGIVGKGSYQVQKFNNNLIEGLSSQEKVVALSSLPVVHKNHDEIIRKIDGVDFFCVKIKKGKLGKLLKVNSLIKKGKEIIRNEKPKAIVCDSITRAVSVAALKLSKKYNIPAIAIVTDVPEKYCGGNAKSNSHVAKLMKKYDGYVLLTEKMNEIVNPNSKPYIVMEGCCNLDENLIKAEKKQREKNIILYSGSLWNDILGLEYFTEGFIKANLHNTELHFYGVGDFKERLKEYSKQCPSVKYMGCVTNAEVVEKQKQASLLINPRITTEEYCEYSFPSKTFEYMASGTPLLMTRLPGIPSEYFDYAYVIEKEDSEYVAEKLNQIFSKSEEERNLFGTKAREFIVKEKNAKKQSAIILEFIKSL